MTIQKLLRCFSQDRMLNELTSFSLTEAERESSSTSTSSIPKPEIENQINEQIV